MNFYFIGVTTRQSAMGRILPLWSKALNIDLQLVGIDIPIDAAPSAYRNAVLAIKDDPKALGAVVTTHKVKVFEHAADLFDEFDSISELTSEVSTIAKRGSKLIGFATTECLSTTFALKDMLDPTYWHTHDSNMLCLGAGGAGRAIALSLLFDFERDQSITTRRAFTPQRLLFVDIDQVRLDSISRLLEPFCEGLKIECIQNSEAQENDKLLAELPSGSLIINATGMGKDRPGSPITDHAVFPAKSIVWELNYRGERQFLQQAESQKARRSLQTHDGWFCFMQGWTQTIQVLLQKKFSAAEFQQLVKIAEPFR